MRTDQPWSLLPRIFCFNLRLHVSRLAIYVYEYLVHVGAKASAQSFLRELNWEKNNIPVGEGPGFLLSWWL